MPASYSPATRGYSNVDAAKLPLGTYTLWHGAGFGFLYQITGEKKYADLGRKCVEKAMEGVRDIDDRNSWLAPSSTMRGGPSVAAIAVAYDLCYDGWEPAFRKKLADEIIHYERKGDKKGSGHLRSSLREYCL